MNEEDYYLKVNEMQSFLNNLKEEEMIRLGYLKKALFTSANFRKYLPQVKATDYFNLIKDVYFYDQLAALEQYFFFLLEKIKVIDDDDYLNQMTSESFIISTFHTGSYRLLIPLLLKLQKKIVIVTEERFIIEQSKGILSLQLKLNKYYNLPISYDLEIFSAQDPSLFFKLRHKLNDGYSVIFYIDGNTGLFEHEIDDNKLLSIRFLDDFINARKGIAYLSILTKKRILSIISKKEDVFNNSVQINLVDIDFKMPKDEFIRDVTKKIYKELEEFLKKNPSQWEGWFYIHKFRKRDTINKITKNKILLRDIVNKYYKYNDTDFKIVNILDKYYIINYARYEINEIDIIIYNTLMLFNRKRYIQRANCIIDGQPISKKVIKELVNLNYLIYEN